MKKKIIKISFTIIGLSSLLFCIMDEVDGIGRFALVVFGTVFVILGSFKKNN